MVEIERLNKKELFIENYYAFTDELNQLYIVGKEYNGRISIVCISNSDWWSTIVSSGTCFEELEELGVYVNEVFCNPDEFTIHFAINR